MNENRFAEQPTANILAAIEAGQRIQKRNDPKSHVWKEASKELHALFAEMARRHKEGAL